MNVAVLGAGGGGLAVAYEWASRGHRVSLYAQRAHDHHLAPVRHRGGIQAEGVLEGFVRLQTVTCDIAEALAGVEVVFVVGPAYATEPFGADARGQLRPGMTVVVCPGSCVGSLAFKHAAGLGLYDQGVVVGETGAGFPALTGCPSGCWVCLRAVTSYILLGSRDWKPTAAFSPAGSGVHETVGARSRVLARPFMGHRVFPVIWRLDPRSWRDRRDVLQEHRRLTHTDGT